MEVEYTITSNSVTAAPQSAGMVQLFHGTDAGTALDFDKHRLDYHRLSYYGGSEFCATTSQSSAEVYALVNPAGGSPIVIRFELPTVFLQSLLTHDDPEMVMAHIDQFGPWYQFYPCSFSIMNEAMSNITTLDITSMPEWADG